MYLTRKIKKTDGITWFRCCFDLELGIDICSQQQKSIQSGDNYAFPPSNNKYIYTKQRKLLKLSK